MPRFHVQTITFQREQNGRIKKFTLTRFCKSPLDAVMEICERAYRRNIEIIGHDLMGQIIKP